VNPEETVYQAPRPARTNKTSIILMVLLCVLLTVNIAVMGFLSYQVYDAHQKYEAILPVAKQVSESNIVKLLIKGENVFNILASGRTAVEIVDQDFIQFNWARGADAVVKGASYLKKIAGLVAISGPNQDIRDVFLYIQTYADWTQSIAQQATGVGPVGELVGDEEIMQKDNSTDNLDDVIDALGELLPFLYKQIDIPKAQAAAKNCATLFKNVLNVNWSGKYRNYYDRRVEDWRIPSFIEDDIFHTILETCEAAASPDAFKPNHSGAVRISDD